MIVFWKCVNTWFVCFAVAMTYWHVAVWIDPDGGPYANPIGPCMFLGSLLAAVVVPIRSHFDRDFR